MARVALDSKDNYYLEKSLVRSGQQLVQLVACSLPAIDQCSCTYEMVSGHWPLVDQYCYGSIHSVQYLLPPVRRMIDLTFLVSSFIQYLSRELLRYCMREPHLDVLKVCRYD